MNFCDSRAPLVVWMPRAAGGRSSTSINNRKVELSEIERQEGSGHYIDVKLQLNLNRSMKGAGISLESYLHKPRLVIAFSS